MGEIESVINNVVFMIYDGTERDHDIQIIVKCAILNWIVMKFKNRLRYQNEIHILTLPINSANSNIINVLLIFKNQILGHTFISIIYLPLLGRYLYFY